MAINLPAFLKKPLANKEDDELGLALVIAAGLAAWGAKKGVRALYLASQPQEDEETDPTEEDPTV